MWQRTKNIYHLLVAVLANAYFRFPGRKLTVIGVTGTDGKTTTSSLIYHILKNSGRNVSLISTVAAYIGDKTYDTGFHVTNPSSIPLQSFLKKICGLVSSSEQNYLVLEVTSHGIDQNRIWGIPFAVGVITNISHEHLDYHKTYDNYLQTKAKLLKKSKVAIINKDDQSFGKLLLTLDGKKTVTYGIEEDADVTPKKYSFMSKMPGSFQEYNELAAMSVCLQLGLTEEEIRKGIESFVLPKGRLERVYDKDFLVVIDFAHTPNAFAKLLPVLKKQTSGRLIHVFGSAGKRDTTKRPEMGKISSEFAEVMIVTAEDPRGESIEKITEEILEQVDKKKEIYKIADRQEAIDTAIKMAQKGDTIIITGKAHETTMNLDGHREIPWSDFDVVKKSLEMRT